MKTMRLTLLVTDRHGELESEKRRLTKQLQNLIDDGWGTDDGKPNITVAVEAIASATPPCDHPEWDHPDPDELIEECMACGLVRECDPLDHAPDDDPYARYGTPEHEWLLMEEEGR